MNTDATNNQYVPVPVDAARRVSMEFGKSVVVIVAYDPLHNLIHTTTYGISAEDKCSAAWLGETLAAAAGVDLSMKRNHEDFRDVPASVYAAENERLRSRVKVLEGVLSKF